MPRYNYNVNGERYFKEQIVWVVARTEDIRFTNVVYDDLRAQDPPGGDFGPLAVVLAFGAAGSGTVHGELWCWNANSIHQDDDSDCLCPTAITHPAPGRWLYMTGTSNT